MEYASLEKEVQKKLNQRSGEVFDLLFTKLSKSVIDEIKDSVGKRTISTIINTRQTGTRLEDFLIEYVKNKREYRKIKKFLNDDVDNFDIDYSDQYDYYRLQMNKYKIKYKLEEQSVLNNS